MSRRRKRKKLNSLETKGSDKQEVVSSHENKPEQLSPTKKTPSTSPEVQPLPSKRIDNKSDLGEEFDLELDDDFTETETNSSENKISLPSSENKTEMRSLRRPSEPSKSEKPLADEASESTKMRRIAKSAEKRSPHEVDLSPLDDEVDQKKNSKSEVISTPELSSKPQEEPQPEQQKAPQVEESHPDTPPLTPEANKADSEKFSFRTLVQNSLGSLSLIEQASLGALTVILVVAAFWSTSVVSARIPNTIIASKLKYPLKGEAVVLASYESYWRSPIREGENIDEGVSESIEIIPEVKVSLDSNSKAKALRFLFRDEEGRYVGDSSTVKISGSTFLPSENVTSSTKGKSAIIRSTTGFEHEGELISYLADETFQWEIVILESKDGIEYTEFMAIPISANRKDNS